MRTIDKIILHCAATKEGRDIKTETIKSWHVKGNGWSDIGYHYVIELDGTVKKGRPMHRSGAHTKGHNTGSIGVCYVGGIDIAKKPKLQQKWKVVVVPTVLILQYDEEKKRYQADLSFKMAATREEVQEKIDEIILSGF